MAKTKKTKAPATKKTKATPTKKAKARPTKTVKTAPTKKTAKKVPTRNISSNGEDVRTPAKTRDEWYDQLLEWRKKVRNSEDAADVQVEDSLEKVEGFGLTYNLSVQRFDAYGNVSVVRHDEIELNIVTAGSANMTLILHRHEDHPQYRTVVELAASMIQTSETCDVSAQGNCITLEYRETMMDLGDEVRIYDNFKKWFGIDVESH